MNAEWYQLLSVISSVIVALLTALATVYWFLIKSLVFDMSTMKKDLSDHKLAVAETYAKSQDVKSLTDAMLARFDIVQSSLSKVDISLATLTERIKHVE